MKKMLVLSMFVSFAMICSCQKQDAAGEAQLAQRKTELDAREEALVQREKAVEEREKAVAEREKGVANSRVIQSQRQGPDAAQAEAERQRRIRQLPPELRALIPDRSRANAGTQDPGAQKPDAQQDAQRKNAMPDAIAFPKPGVPNPQTTSTSPSPAPE